jgi:lipopolysaccharide assembly outer membrane protein LptD (OstA)
LDWDRKNQTVTTADQVNIARDNMMAVALGASGEPNLKKVDLEKEVNVQIFPKEKSAEGSLENKTKITITCDGPLQVDYEAGIATFNNNVKVDRDDAQIYSDTLLVYFLNDLPSKDQEPEKKDAAGAEGVAAMGSKIDKIIARGNVKIVQGENISYSQEAVYSGLSKKITLVGKPRLVIYSTEEMSSNALTGN